MTAAMAWRVKYRKVDVEGEALKMFIPIEQLGVHQGSLPGVYPAGVRCKRLCEDVMARGFVKHECNHAGVAVEELPYDAAGLRSADYVSLRDFNVRSAGEDAVLSTCFSKYTDLRHGTLSHSHMM